MIMWHVGKESLHQRAQTARDPLHQPGSFGQTHNPEPHRHDSNQAECDHHGGFRALDRAVGHVVQAVVPTADDDGANDQRQPDVIEHVLCFSRAR